MKRQETQKYLRNKFAFRVLVIMLVIFCFVLLVRHINCSEIVTNLLLGICGSALVWGFVELFDFIVDTIEAYKKQRDNLLGIVLQHFSSLRHLISYKSSEKIEIEQISKVTRELYNDICEYPYHGEIYALSKEFQEIANYTLRLDMKMSALLHCFGSNSKKSEEIKQKIYDTLVICQTQEIDFSNFVKQQSKIDNAYQQMTEIDINFTHYDIPKEIFASDDCDLGQSVRFASGETSISQNYAFRPKKDFQKIFTKKEIFAKKNCIFYVLGLLYRPIEIEE